MENGGWLLPLSWGQYRAGQHPDLVARRGGRRGLRRPGRAEHDIRQGPGIDIAEGGSNVENDQPRRTTPRIGQTIRHSPHSRRAWLPRASGR